MPNNTLELCKRLKDAGFPQGGNGLWWIENNYKKANPDVINASWQYKKQLFSVGPKDNIFGFIDVMKRFPFPEYSIIAYEPTIIEVARAVKKEGLNYKGWKPLFFFITYIYDEDAYEVQILFDKQTGEEDNLETIKYKNKACFTAIAELWLKIRGM